MKKKTETVTIAYEFKVEYEHPDHRKHIIEDLTSAPMNDMCGAGFDDKHTDTYSYSCKRIGKGAVL